MLKYKEIVFSKPYTHFIFVSPNLQQSHQLPHETAFMQRLTQLADPISIGKVFIIRPKETWDTTWNFLVDFWHLLMNTLPPEEFLHEVPSVDSLMERLTDEDSKMLCFFDDLMEELYNNSTISQLYSRLSSHFQIGIVLNSTFWVIFL